ncbi:hypothetical protein Zmor_024867 [Zophobas morio]|uniref:Uncharacterized protein n=1 Tax=Zophobas morio TaxID=2755281 RepID=A0AA38HR20_9CUCU|nr:hypothetical protein Zmor_024867 [Zophobas morio]
MRKQILDRTTSLHFNSPKNRLNNSTHDINFELSPALKSHHFFTLAIYQIYSPTDPAVSSTRGRRRRRHQEMAASFRRPQTQFGDAKLPAHHVASTPLAEHIAPRPPYKLSVMYNVNTLK